MRKGFFVSIDLIITIAAVIFLFGFLGVYLHNSILDYSQYKQDMKMQATMNIVLNKIANSDLSCDLVDSFSNSLNKKVSFCIDKQKYSLTKPFSDLDYNVSLDCGLNCLDTKSYSENFIAKDISILIVDNNLSKAEYFKCTQGLCDINKLVRVYVWK